VTLGLDTLGKILVCVGLLGMLLDAWFDSPED